MATCAANNDVLGEKVGLILFFTVLLALTIAFRLKNKCNTFPQVAIGALIGLAAGWGNYFLWEPLNSEKFIYFTDNNSSAEYCNRPSGQKFKCSVYKNGELIQNL